MGTKAERKTGLSKASRVITSGGLVAFPTESFYGLGVDATNEDAIQLLLDVKERGGEHPILILIPSQDILAQYVQEIPAVAGQLVKAFWPGGLTLIFQADKNVSPLLTAGTGKIGIRLSSHSVATGLALEAGIPITGTSANMTGTPPCDSAEEVFRAMGKKVDLILDGGKTEGRKGSTVLDVTVNPPEILREGMVSRDELAGFF